MDGFFITEKNLPCVTESWETLPSAQHWFEHLEKLQDTGKPTDPGQALKQAMDNPPTRQLIAGVLCHSPFLTQCIMRQTAFFNGLLQHGPDHAFARILQNLADQPAQSTDQIRKNLRQVKQQAALTIALAEISGQWDTEKAVQALTDFADRAIQTGLEQQLREQSNRLPLANPDNPQENCGYVALAMGKQGAGELNYSSDIDLIILFDPDRYKDLPAHRIQDSMVRLTRNLMRLLSERTEDGYVFRTDLRLRPNPGATPIALSCNAALSYYESLALNWERAAMIKARPVAGDLALGDYFLSEIRPFIWRKHLDFTALDDIYDIKCQISQHKGKQSLKIPGHNVKLGRGGIRTIEFFAQTQQLVWGGRDPDLRTRKTCQALRILAQRGHIQETTCHDLEQSYWFLRRLENRIQMVDDQQTHSIPDTDEKLGSLAAFMGYNDTERFATDVLAHFQSVEAHDSQLFQTPSETQEAPQLVFAGSEPSPQIITELSALKFEDPVKAFDIVMQWNAGQHRAVRSDQSRARISQILPALLSAFSNSGHPDQALIQFDHFLSTLPTGIQLFALLQANPNLLDLLAEIMGTAPRLAQVLGENPNLLDAVLSGHFFDPLPNRDSLKENLEKRLEEARDYQDTLDLTRRWAREFRFQVGVQILRDSCDVAEGHRALSDLADVTLNCLLPKVEQEFAKRHGIIAESSFAVVAFGKLGSREMTPTSDLDLVCLYDAPAGKTALRSDGDRPLEITTYFIRLTQRLINALTATTGEGALYDIDMRLRPSGSAGPLALSLTAFEQYHSTRAWTWEHMALTRARAIAGPQDFLAQISKIIEKQLCAERDSEKLRQDILDMRRKLYQEKPPRGPLDGKANPGRIIDLEFLAQFFQLSHAPKDRTILQKNTFAVLDAATKSGLLPAQEGTKIAIWLDQLQRLERLLRLTSVDKAVDISETTKNRALKIFDATTLDDMIEKIEYNSTAVHQIFIEKIGDYGAQSR